MHKIVFLSLLIYIVYSQTNITSALGNPDIQAAMEIGTNPTPLPPTCGPERPTSSYDCTKFNNMTQYCCYIESFNNLTSPSCKPIGPTTITPDVKTIKLNNTDYKINCDIKIGSVGTPCGISNPRSLDDCSAASSHNNSCCWYHMEANNSTIDYCFWVGQRMSGSIIPSVQCSAEYLNLVIIGMIMLILF